MDSVVELYKKQNNNNNQQQKRYVLTFCGALRHILVYCFHEEALGMYIDNICVE